MSDAVLRSLKALVPNTSRIFGADRYATSRAVAERFIPQSEVAVLATGRGYADALVAGAAAGRLGAPNILIDGARSTIDAATLTSLRSMDARKIILAGGHASISIALEQDLRTRGFDVSRMGGATRYETAVRLMQADSDDALSGVLLASGENFPDALAAASFAAQTGSSLYLTRATCVPSTAQGAIQEAGDIPRNAELFNQ